MPNSEKKKILFVDDEKQVLKSLRRLFFRSNYNCFYVSSGKEALVILKEYDIDLLITDIRMPKMNGFELLKKVKKHYPTVIRIALSGYSDNAAIVDAIQKSLIKLYLYKPWDNQELLSKINRIFEMEKILNDKDILKFVSDLENLPTLPKIIEDINSAIEGNESINTIVKRVEIDQSLATKVLKVANSAFYSAKTGSIKQAIMYIGLLNLKNIVLANSIFKKVDSELSDKLWKHALLTNKITGFIYTKVLLKKIPNNYASAGLLHDIGRVILWYYSAEDMKKINILNNKNPVDLSKKLNYETKIIGITHAQIGAYLLEWWEIPLPIVEAALFHHDPFNENVIHQELIYVIYLANHHAWNIMSPEHETDTLEDEIFEKLDIPREKFVEKIKEFKNTLR